MTKLAIPSLPAVQQTSLTHRTARGFLWLTVDAVGSKVITFFAQILLARLLMPEHFGLIGLVYTVTTFADLVSHAGFRELLIRRQRRFDAWAKPAVWMSISLGLLAGAVAAAAAPLAAWLYEAPEVIPLILITAISMPMWSAGVVPEASLRRHMRFRAISVVGLGRTLSMSLLSVAFAAWGLEAYSFVWPRLIAGGLCTAALWWLARPPVELNLHVKRWRYMIGDTGLIFFAALIVTVIGQVSYIALGILHTEHVVGTYFFAYNLSLQTAVFLGLNFAGVLLPALSLLQKESNRQLQAFLRAGRVLAAVGIPMGLLQAAVAEPAIRVIFGERWAPAIPVLQILSLGMAFHVMWNSSRSMMQAQGRFRTYLVLVSLYAAIFISLIVAAALLGAEVSVAIATSLFFGLVAPVDTYVAIRGSGGTWRDVWNIYAWPIAMSIVSIGPGMLIGSLFAPGPIRDWAMLAGIPIASFAIYALGLRAMQPEVWRDLMERAGALLGRRA